MREIILASSSIARKKILQNLGLKFKVIPANLDEEKIIASNPITLRQAQGDAEPRRSIKLVEKIARTKALAVFKKLKTRCYPLNAIIIAADSMIVFKGRIYGKPNTKDEAKEFLQVFSGKTHEFLTGVCVISCKFPEGKTQLSSGVEQSETTRLNTKANKIYQTSAKSKVRLGKLTPKEINGYVETASVTSFAGGYSLEGKGSEIIRKKMKIVGSETNVIGLPVEKLIPILKKELVNTRKSPLE